METGLPLTQHGSSCWGSGQPAHMSSIWLTPISGTSAMQNVICNSNTGTRLRSLNF